MTNTIHISALAAASLISGLLLWVSHEMMKSDLYRDISITVRYAVGIICGMGGALAYGVLSGDWLLLVGIVALFCPGGALVIARYGLRSIERERGRQRLQADFVREEILRGETRGD